MNDRNFVRAFETSEYRARLDKVRALMSKAGMDALVIISQANQCYLLGYESFSGDEPQAMLVTLEDDPYFILRKMDADTAAEAGCLLPQDRVIGYSESYVAGSGESLAGIIAIDRRGQAVMTAAPPRRTPRVPGSRPPRAPSPTAP